MTRRIVGQLTTTTFTGLKPATYTLVQDPLPGGGRLPSLVVLFQPWSSTGWIIARVEFKEAFRALTVGVWDMPPDTPAMIVTTQYKGEETGTIDVRGITRDWRGDHPVPIQWKYYPKRKSYRIYYPDWDNETLGWATYREDSVRWPKGLEYPPFGPVWARLATLLLHGAYAGQTPELRRYMRARAPRINQLRREGKLPAGWE